MKHKVCLFFDLSEAEKALIRSHHQSEEFIPLTTYENIYLERLSDLGILIPWIENNKISYTYSIFGEQIKKALNL